MVLTEEQKSIILEIDSIAKAKTFETNYRKWLRNVGENRELGTSRTPLSKFKLPDGRNKDTLIIVGPGASMKQYENDLWQLRTYATICQLPTGNRWVREHRLYPDYMVVQDSAQHPAQLEGNKAPLLAPTTIGPELAKANWTHLYLFTLLIGRGLGDPIFGQYNEFSLLIDSDLDGGVGSMGCVTNMAVELAIMLGKSGQLNFKRIVLLGCDYAGWNGFMRVPVFGGDEFPHIDTAPDDVKHEWVKWQGYDTDPRMILYKWYLMRLWARSEAPIYSMSHGILTEFPSVSFEQVVTGKWPKAKRYPSKRRIDEMFLEYSALMAETFPREEDDGSYGRNFSTKEEE